MGGSVAVGYGVMKSVVKSARALAIDCCSVISLHHEDSSFRELVLTGTSLLPGTSGKGFWLTEAPDFELGATPGSNIVCFRYVPQTETDLDALQPKIRQRLIQSGAFYIVQTRIPKGLFLRTALMNPLTTEDDLRALLDAIRSESPVQP